MSISVENEAFIFICMAILGMLIGLLFDIFRVIHRTTKLKSVTVGITDMLFWIIATLSVFLGIYYLNDGQLRWYEFIGLFLGLLIYFVSLSNAVIWVLIKITGIISEIIKFIFKICLTPILFLYKILWKSFCLILGLIKKILKTLETKIVKIKNKVYGLFEKRVKAPMRKRQSKNKKKVSILFLAVFAVISAMAVKTIIEQPKILENKAEIARLNNQIEYEKMRSQEVDAMKDKVNSDEYIEKVARDKLGLIKENEKVFVDVSGQ